MGGGGTEGYPVVCARRVDLESTALGASGQQPNMEPPNMAHDLVVSNYLGRRDVSSRQEGFDDLPPQLARHLREQRVELPQPPEGGEDVDEGHRRSEVTVAEVPREHLRVTGTTRTSMGVVTAR